MLTFARNDQATKLAMLRVGRRPATTSGRDLVQHRLQGGYRDLCPFARIISTWEISRERDASPRAAPHSPQLALKALEMVPLAAAQHRRLPSAASDGARAIVGRAPWAMHHFAPFRGRGSAQHRRWR